MKSVERVPSGSDALVRGVDRFFDVAVPGDPLLKLYFMDTDLARHKAHFAVYLSHVLAGTEDRYPGRSVLAAHVGREIMDEATDVFVGKLAQALRDCGVPSADAGKIETKLAALKDTVVDSFVSPDKYVYKPQRMG